MNIHLSKQLLHWNSLYQQLNEIYRQYATQKGVSETTLWLLYFLCEHGGSCEQRALCRELIRPTPNRQLQSEKAGTTGTCFFTACRWQPEKIKKYP